MVIALTPEQELVTVNLYRYTIKTKARELPAGAAETDKNETTELYVLPSETNRWIHYYLALNAHQVEKPKLDSIVEKYFDMS